MLRQAERFSTQTSMTTKKEKEKQRESTDTMRLKKKKHNPWNVTQRLTNASYCPKRHGDLPSPPCRVGWIVFSFKP
jgi:hypothetical protein